MYNTKYQQQKRAEIFQIGLKPCADHKKKELLVPGKGKSSGSGKFLKNDYD